MAGRKQHYIPQALLRGFGKQGKGKAVQVTVYTAGGNVFTTATHGVAAQRYFYSELPDDAGVETLDDKITAFESRLSEILEEFHRVLPGHAVHPTKAAEAVAHLCGRQAHVRDSFACATGHLLSGTANLFRDKEWLWKTLGLDDVAPNEMMRTQIRQVYERIRNQIDPTNITQIDFEQWAFMMLKAEFDNHYSTQMRFLRSFFDHLQTQTAKMARDAHVKALDQSLAPEARIAILKQFAWRIEPGRAGSFILPDCVVTSWSAAASFQPLFYAGKNVDAVFMPLRYDRLLVGERGEAAGNTTQIMNEVSAACSWDCFIARDRNPEFQQLIPRIGERARQLMDDAVRVALDAMKT